MKRTGATRSSIHQSFISIVTGIILCFLISALFASANARVQEFSWSSYNDLLQRVVSKQVRHNVTLNWVNYSQLRSDPEFAGLIEELADFPTENLKTDNEKKAFYINAYNIIAMQIVTEHWPIESIKDVGSFLRPVWKRKLGVIGGEKISLHTIEHEILRPMGDSRIHMAIVCASISCPDLRTEPYFSDRLDQQLDNQARTFLNNPGKGLVMKDFKVYVSKIFDWFEVDFEKDYGSVEKFLFHFSNLTQGLEIKNELPYNWSVNGE